MNLTEVLLNLMGYVLADAAYFCHDLESGQLIAPFAIVQLDTEQQYRFFEAESQDEAVAKGLHELKQLSEADMWVFAHDGRIKNDAGEAVDVLVVEGWQAGMGETISVLQHYMPNGGNGSFRLIGEPYFMIEGRTGDFGSDGPRNAVIEGIRTNPRAGKKWAGWTNDA